MIQKLDSGLGLGFNLSPAIETFWASDTLSVKNPSIYLTVL